MSIWLHPDAEDASGEGSPEDINIRELDSTNIDLGTNILIAGPAMTGKRRLGIDILSGSPSQTACIVSTKHPAKKVDRAFTSVVDGRDAWDLSIVDCTGGGIRPQKLRESTVKTVSGPNDLTGIGIHLSGILQRWSHQNINNPRMMLHTLSTLLMYTDLKRVFRFVHVVLSRMQEVDAITVATLDTTSMKSDSFSQIALVKHVVDFQSAASRACLSASSPGFLYSSRRS